uniref:AAA-ATPase-like domain-containing protein n=1 Tax=Hirondellea gigas TaxID=1518452 RepID=A0A6A7G128_9CRUS
MNMFSRSLKVISSFVTKQRRPPPHVFFQKAFQSSGGLLIIKPGFQSFEQLMKPSIAYVDKTAPLVDLVRFDTPYDRVFLSRPRKWGKSVTVDTLACLFQNKRDLFEGTEICDHPDVEWIEYPVVRLDFSILKVHDLRRDLVVELASIGTSYGVTVGLTPSSTKADVVNVERAAKQLFTQLASNSKTGKIVLLVDEYDAPVTKLLEWRNKTADALLVENLQILQEFYSVVKALGHLFRFQFVTGVSKFVKSGVFSGVNHLTDISMIPRFSSMLGFTWEEIQTDFAPHLLALGKELNLSSDDLHAKITQWYNGYSWCGPDRVYNPYSICRLLSDQTFEPYWIQAGTPGWLLRLINHAAVVNTTEWDNQFVAKSKFDEIELNTMGNHSFDITNLLFRTGYLTVKDQQQDPNNMKTSLLLGYPNFEVRDTFLPQVVRTLCPKMPDITECQRLLNNDDVVGFFMHLATTAFASIPGNISMPDEKWFHSIVHVILVMMGHEYPSELWDASGRLDLKVGNAYVEVKSAAIGNQGGLAELNLEEKTGSKQVVNRKPDNISADRLVVIFNSKPPRGLLKIVSVARGRENKVLYQSPELLSAIETRSTP